MLIKSGKSDRVPGSSRIWSLVSWVRNGNVHVVKREGYIKELDMVENACVCTYVCV